MCSKVICPIASSGPCRHGFFRCLKAYELRPPTLPGFPTSSHPLLTNYDHYASRRLPSTLRALGTPCWHCQSINRRLSHHVDGIERIRRRLSSTQERGRHYHSHIGTLRGIPTFRSLQTAAITVSFRQRVKTNKSECLGLSTRIHKLLDMIVDVIPDATQVSPDILFRLEGFAQYALIYYSLSHYSHPSFDSAYFMMPKPSWKACGLAML
jgi:hypothetical protein